jgi:hypothetical protein
MDHECERTRQKVDMDQRHDNVGGGHKTKHSSHSIDGRRG